jgi:SAM-dependent methyltransferase
VSWVRERMSDYQGGFWKSKKNALGSLSFLHKTIYSKAGLLRAKDQADWINNKGVVQSLISVLDVGSGYGGNIIVWDRMGAFVNGIEPDSMMAESINKRFKTEMVKSVFFEYYTGDTVDLVLASHVLEHFKDVKIFFDKLKTLQVKGGLVFVEVPCCDNLKVDDLSRSNPDHVYHFNQDTLGEIFTDNGYEIVASETLLSFIDHITKPKLSKLQRLFKTFNVLFAKNKSVKASPETADVIRLLAVKR